MKAGVLLLCGVAAVLTYYLRICTQSHVWHHSFLLFVAGIGDDDEAS